jgi:O-antigen polymerase
VVVFLESLNTPGGVSIKQRSLFLACVTLVALPWLWVFDAGPKPGLLTDLVAWGSGALLLCFLPTLAGRCVQAAAWGWLLAASINAFFALLQYFDLENAYSWWIATAKPGVAYGNVQQENFFATLLSAGFISLVYLLRSGRLNAKLAYGIGALLIVGFALAASRIGLLELFVISCILFYWRPWPVKKMLLHAAAAGVLLVAMSWLLPSLLLALLGEEAPRQLLQRLSASAGCASRWLIWSNVLELIAQKPWTGWGWDGLLYAHYITGFEGARSCGKLSHAHNLYLQFAVEFGVPLALGVLMATAWLIWRFKPWQVTDDAQRFAWLLLAVLWLHSMVEQPLWFGAYQVMALVAMVIAITPRMQPVPNTAQQLISRLRMTVAGVLLGILVFVAVDYHLISQLYLPKEWRSDKYRENTFQHAKKTVLFKSYALIPLILGTTIDASNAKLILLAAEQALHIEPDPRVIERLLLAAKVLDRQDLLSLHAARYQAAWPKQYEAWAAHGHKP